MDFAIVVVTLAFCYLLSKFLAFINQLDEITESKSNEKLRDYRSKSEIGVGFASDCVKIQSLSETEHSNEIRRSSEKLDQPAVEIYPAQIQEVEKIGSAVKMIDSGSCGSSESADQVFDEMPLREKIAEETEFVEEEEFEEEDWEGIESTELERTFGAAVCFVGDRSNADQIMKLSVDIKMQMYGLHKVATQGPCNQPQPMRLKMSARAKWNAWKNVGDMSPEEAMEQYIYLLSKSIPGWMQDSIIDSADAKVSPKPSSDQANAVDDM